MPSTAVLVVIIIVAFYLFSSIKILKEYERGVIFRLGRLLSSPKGPGIVLVFRPFDQIVRISLRQEAMEVPAQDIITRDNVTLKVNAVITLRVIDAAKAVVEVSNYVYQTSQFAQTTLRSVLGEVELDELLAHREKLNLKIQTIIDQHTSPYGLKVVSVEVKQVDLPESMLRAMARQAEAEREKRAKIINAEGEFNAAQRLVEAATLLAQQPITMQLRYLQTLSEIGAEKNTTIVFPLPLELVSLLKQVGQTIQPKSGGDTSAMTALYEETSRLPRYDGSALEHRHDPGGFLCRFADLCRIFWPGIFIWRSGKFKVRCRCTAAAAHRNATLGICGQFLSKAIQSLPRLQQRHRGSQLRLLQALLERMILYGTSGHTPSGICHANRPVPLQCLPPERQRLRLLPRTCIRQQVK